MTTPKSKRTNSRKFPGIAGRRPDNAAYRREEALKRNAAYAALPEEEKKARNPKKYEKKS
jgi:hypothetical protein